MGRDGSPNGYHRSTTDLMLLIITGTICVSVVFSVIGLAVVESVDPKTDHSQAAQVIGSIVSTLVGLLAGFLAGRTGRNVDESR